LGRRRGCGRGYSHNFPRIFSGLKPTSTFSIDTGVIWLTVGAMTYPNYKTWVSSRIKSNSILGNIPVGKGLSTPCLEYAGGKLAHKYGLVSIIINGKRKKVPSHRAMYMAVNDCFDLPSSVNICHKCDNPPCIEIGHLFEGSSSDNAQDKLAKGRNAKKYKSHTRIRVHSDEKVLAIRAATGKHKWIAEKFGVSVGYVSKIKSGKLKAILQ